MGSGPPKSLKMRSPPRKTAKMAIFPLSFPCKIGKMAKSPIFGPPGGPPRVQIPPKTGPNGPQRGPNSLQRGPNRLQRGPNSPQRGPNGPPNGPFPGNSNARTSALRGKKGHFSINQARTYRHPDGIQVKLCRKPDHIARRNPIIPLRAGIRPQKPLKKGFLEEFPIRVKN